MNRAIPLFAAIAVFGGGLAFLALKTSPEEVQPQLPGTAESMGQPDAGTQAKTPARGETKETELATIKDIDRSAPAVGSSARYWEVIPMNALGQRVDEAVLTATPTGQLEGAASGMEASGRTKWNAVPAGIWKLTVEVEGEPTWERDVVVEAGKPVRTPVYIGDELRISGEVRDSNGAPLPRNTPVFILSKGARHPAQADVARNARDGGESTPNGVVAVQTDAKGRFRTRLPSAGEYRISVGTPRGTDDARWTQPKGVELTHGGPDHVITTVPARAELTVRLSGPEAERPTAMSAYMYDAERAAQIQAQQQTQARDVRADGAAEGLQEAQRAAKEAALEQGMQGKNGPRASKNGGNGKGGGRSTGTARTMSEENAKMQDSNFDAASSAQGGGVGASNAPLFEAGWRSVGSRSIDPNGEIVFNDLPADKELRFLFVRGSERIATQVPIRMRKEQRAIGTVVLPPPSLEPGFQQNALATIQLKDRPEDPESPRLKVGVEWKVAGQ